MIASTRISTTLRYLNLCHQVLSWGIVLGTLFCIGCEANVAEVWNGYARLVLLASLMICATINDLATFRIPNTVTYTSFICALLLISANVDGNGEFAQTIPTLSDACVAVLVCSGFMLTGWMIKSVGAGDVKLVAGAAALLGLSDSVACFLMAHLIAALSIGVWAVFSMGYRMIACHGAGRHIVRENSLSGSWRSSLAATMSGATMRIRIPMAGFYAISTVTVFVTQAS